MSRRRKHDWLKMQPPSGQEFTGIKQTLRDHDLQTGEAPGEPSHAPPAR